jgi:large subunit ribosomal protein L29
MPVKASELRDLTDKELNQRLDELYQEILNLRHQSAFKQLDNPKRIREAKRTIARILTILRERSLSQKEGEKR